MQPWYHTPDPSDGLISTEEWVAIGELFGLTGRELNAAILLFHSRTRAGMARSLSRSAGSVRKRIDKVFEKFNVKDRMGFLHRLWQVHRVLFHAGWQKQPEGAERCTLQSQESGLS